MVDFVNFINVIMEIPAIVFVKKIVMNKKVKNIKKYETFFK